MPIHLRPSAPTAADAVLCGDPARALALAQQLLVEPRMSNHHRGLWGYWGRSAGGGELTVQATGIGGPSAAVVVHELVDLGVRRAIRVGTCAALDPATPPAARLVIEGAIARDGTSAALGAGADPELRPDPALTARLLADGIPGAIVESVDLHYREDAAAGIASGSTRAGVTDLQSAAVLALGRRLGVATAAVLVVASGPRFRLEDDPLEAALLEAGELAAGALARG